MIDPNLMTGKEKRTHRKVNLVGERIGAIIVLLLLAAFVVAALSGPSPGETRIHNERVELRETEQAEDEFNEGWKQAEENTPSEVEIERAEILKESEDEYTELEEELKEEGLR